MERSFHGRKVQMNGINSPQKISDGSVEDPYLGAHREKHDTGKNNLLLFSEPLTVAFPPWEGEPLAIETHGSGFLES